MRPVSIGLLTIGRHVIVSGSSFILITLTSVSVMLTFLTATRASLFASRRAMVLLVLFLVLLAFLVVFVTLLRFFIIFTVSSPSPRGQSISSASTNW